MIGKQLSNGALVIHGGKTFLIITKSIRILARVIHPLLECNNFPACTIYIHCVHSHNPYSVSSIASSMSCPACSQSGFPHMGDKHSNYATHCCCAIGLAWYWRSLMTLIVDMWYYSVSFNYWWYFRYAYMRAWFDNFVTNDYFGRRDNITRKSVHCSNNNTRYPHNYDTQASHISWHVSLMSRINLY